MKIIAINPRFKKEVSNSSRRLWFDFMGREPETKKEIHHLAVDLADQMLNLFGQVESGIKIKYEDLIKVAGRLLIGNVKKNVPEKVVQAAICMLGELEPEFGKYSVTWRVNYCIRKILIYGGFAETLGAARARMEQGGHQEQEPAFHEVIWKLAQEA